MATYETIIRGKWIYDGCNTLDEMAAAARAQADTLIQMTIDGLKLANPPADDDYAFLTVDDPSVDVIQRWNLTVVEDVEDGAGD